jgi:hypothetical protein
MSWFERRLFELKQKPRLTAYQAVRSSRYLFVRYQSGEQEFYDLASDPAQLRNIVAEVDRRIIKRHSLWLDQLRACKGSECQKAEDFRSGEMHLAP